jgi:acetyl esterase/lipase
MKRLLKESNSKSIAKRRIVFDQSSKKFKVAKTVCCMKADMNGISGEWLVPKDGVRNAAILYLHGGAYVVGSPTSHRAMVSQIAAASSVSVLSLDYRLAPEHPFPAAQEDAVAAFLWLQEKCNIPAERIVVMGDSAGGGLTLSMAIRLRDIGLPLPRALICISPWTDLTMGGDSVKDLMGKDPFFTHTDELSEAASAYAGGALLDNPGISPLFADMTGLPDLFVQVGADEILLSDSLDLVEAAKKVGIEARADVWPGMWHVWHLFHDYMPESRQALSAIGSRVREFLP